jgi:hypothetical protein
MVQLSLWSIWLSLVVAVLVVTTALVVAVVVC